jgi:hypothetical protein
MESNDGVRPGYPGRGYDPTRGFSDLQWYMFYQRGPRRPRAAFFRIRVARRERGADAEGRRSVLVWVSHAFAEGVDSARLSHSRSAAHAKRTASRPASRIPLAAHIAGGLGAVAHLTVFSSTSLGWNIPSQRFVHPRFIHRDET